MRDLGALLATGLLSTMGDQIEYSDNGAAYVVLIGDAQEVDRSLEYDAELECEVSKKDFFIPKQTNFPPANGMNIKNRIRFPITTGKIYQVETWEECGEGTDGVPAGYTVHTFRTQLKNT